MSLLRTLRLRYCWQRFRLHQWIQGMKLCRVDHRCVVCGCVALHAGHGRRGSPKGWARRCPEYFNVRCCECRRLHRLPHTDLFKMHYEMTDAEHLSGLSNDGRKFVFEVV